METQNALMPLTCCACGLPVATAHLRGVDNDALCSAACKGEYTAYLSRELHRARQAFKNRTPEQKERVLSWEIFAAKVNGANAQITA